MSKKSKATREREAAQKRVANAKLHGVITEAMVPEQTERAGLAPFTFSSALLIMGAALVGGILIPWQASTWGIDVNVSMTAALPPLLALALAVSRYYVDTDRHACRGFWVLLGATWLVTLVILYLLLFCGIALT